MPVLSHEIGDPAPTTSWASRPLVIAVEEEPWGLGQALFDLPVLLDLVRFARGRDGALARLAK